MSSEERHSVGPFTEAGGKNAPRFSKSGSDMSFPLWFAFHCAWALLIPLICTGEPPETSWGRVSRSTVGPGHFSADRGNGKEDRTGPGNLPVASDSTWRLDFDLRIGSLEDIDQAFTSITQLLPSGDGSLFALDSEQNEIYSYSPSGVLQDRLGGSGPGPGEFYLPVSLGWWRGEDSIWVQDLALRRVTIFAKDGEVARTFPLNEVDYATDLRIRLVDHFLSDGEAVALANPRSFERERTDIPLVRLAGDEVVSELLRLDRSGSTVPIRGDPQGGFMVHPLPDGPLVGFEPAGDLIVVVDRTAHSGDGSPSIEVQAWHARSGLVWNREIPYSASPIPSRVADSIGSLVHGRFRDMYKNDGLSEREIREIHEKTIVLPRYYPPIHSVVIEAGGRIWLNWAKTIEGPGITILNRDGSTLAQVIRPTEDLPVTAVAGDFAWGVQHDDLDVPYIIRWKIRK